MSHDEATILSTTSFKISLKMAHDIMVETTYTHTCSKAWWHSFFFFLAHIYTLFLSPLPYKTIVAIPFTFTYIKCIKKSLVNEIQWDWPKMFTPSGISSGETYLWKIRSGSCLQAITMHDTDVMIERGKSR